MFYAKSGQGQRSNSISNVENALAFKASLFAAITLLDAEQICKICNFVATVLVAASRMVHSATALLLQWKSKMRANSLIKSILELKSKMMANSLMKIDSRMEV